MHECIFNTDINGYAHRIVFKILLFFYSHRAEKDIILGIGIQREIERERSEAIKIMPHVMNIIMPACRVGCRCGSVLFCGCGGISANILCGVIVEAKSKIHISTSSSS